MLSSQAVIVVNIYFPDGMKRSDCLAIRERFITKILLFFIVVNVCIYKWEETNVAKIKNTSAEVPYTTVTMVTVVCSIAHR